MKSLARARSLFSTCGGLKHVYPLQWGFFFLLNDSGGLETLRFPDTNIDLSSSLEVGANWWWQVELSLHRLLSALHVSVSVNWIFEGLLLEMVQPRIEMMNPLQPELN